MKFKVGDKVMTTADTGWWNQGEIGIIRRAFQDISASYHVYFVDTDKMWHIGEDDLVAVPPEVKTTIVEDVSKEFDDPYTTVGRYSSKNPNPQTIPRDIYAHPALEAPYGSTKTNPPLTISQLQKEVHELAKEKGWYDPPKTDLECMALVHSEISEAVEELRTPGTPPYMYHYDAIGNMVIDEASWDVTQKPEGLASELADAVIRILDYCEYKGIDLEQAIRIKHAYNRTRAYRHGKKL